MRRTAGYTWADYKTNSHITKELEITPVLDKLLEYKRNWIQHVNRLPRDRLPRIMKHYSPTGRRKRGRLLKRLLDTWDRNGSTSGLTPWQTYDDDDDNKNKGANNSIQSINIKASTSVFITKWEPYSIYSALTYVNFGEISFIIFSTTLALPSPCWSLCVMLLQMAVYGVVLYIFAVFYYFCLLITNIQITLYSDIITLITSLMTSHRTQCTFW